MDNQLIGDENNIVFYTDEEDNINVEVILQNENVWLNTESIAKLFKVQRPAITKHINNIYTDEELEENSTCSKMEQVQNEGSRRVTRNISYYNLDMIISIGFRVNSKPAIKFRKWANKIIKEYMIKGFTFNDERFINGNKIDVKYFNELLERIKTVRVSERMSYQKINDLLKYRKKNILENAGTISHKQAIDKANNEYEKFSRKQDQQYISSMDKMLGKYLKENIVTG